MKAETIRPLGAADMAAVARIYERHRGAPPPASWRKRVGALVSEGVAKVAEAPSGQVVGYVVGEVRSWEFGSEPAGWIFAIGVDPEHQRGGVAQRLLRAAAAALADMGVRSLRTMVKRDDVPVLRFFRNSGFRAGPYTELEIDLHPEGL